MILIYKKVEEWKIWSFAGCLPFAILATILIPMVLLAPFEFYFILLLYYVNAKHLSGDNKVKMYKNR